MYFDNRREVPKNVWKQTNSLIITFGRLQKEKKTGKSDVVIVTNVKGLDLRRPKGLLDPKIRVEIIIFLYYLILRDFPYWEEVLIILPCCEIMEFVFHHVV